MNLGHDNHPQKVWSTGVAKVPIFCTMNIKNRPKTAKKATIAFQHGAFLHYGGYDDDIRFRRSPKGVLHPAETISIIYSILLKKSLLE